MTPDKDLWVWKTLWFKHNLRSQRSRAHFFYLQACLLCPSWPTWSLLPPLGPSVLCVCSLDHSCALCPLILREFLRIFVILLFLLTPFDFIIPDNLVMHIQLPNIKFSWSLTALGFLTKSCDSDLGLGSKHCSLNLKYALYLCYSTPPRSSCQNKIKHGKILLGEKTVWDKLCK